MIKLKIFFALLLLFNSISFGQIEHNIVPNSNNKPKIFKSNPYDQSKTNSSEYFETNNDILAIKKVEGKNLTEFSFKRFSGDSLTELFELKDCVTKQKLNSAYFNAIGFKKIGNEIYFFYSYFDSKAKTEGLFARLINKEKGGFEGEIKELIKIPEKIEPELNGKFIFKYSENNSKLIVQFNYYKPRKNTPKGKEKIGVIIFNSHLEKEWQNNLALPYNDHRYKLINVEYESNGTAYLFLKKIQTRVNAHNNDEYELLQVTQSGEKKTIPFTLEEHHIQHVQMIKNVTGKLIFTGYYTKDINYGVEGVFSCEMLENNEFSKTIFHEFSGPFVIQYHKSFKRKLVNSQNEAKDNFRIDDLNLRSVQTLYDGSILLTGELYSGLTYTDENRPISSTHFYDDIILTKLDADGNLCWMKKIPKRSKGSSFKQHVFDNHLFITFFDNLKNQSLDPNSNPVRANGSLVIYSIDLINGKHNYSEISNKHIIDGNVVTKFPLTALKSLNDSVFVLEAPLKKKTEILFRIELMK